MMKKSRCLFVALMVLCLSFGITSKSFGLCFVTDVKCLAGMILPFNQYDSANDSKKEWSAVRGYIVAENNYISFNFMFDQESIDTLRYEVSSIFGGFGLEVEIVEKNGHVLDLDFITNNLPTSSNPRKDTNVCDYVTNIGSNDHVNALLIRNPENLQKDVWYEVCFVFKNNIPSNGVLIQPNLVIDLDMDDLTYLYSTSVYKYLIRLLTEESSYLEQFEYYTLETDCYKDFTARSDGSGVYWQDKIKSTVCNSKPHLTSAIEAVNNEADGTIPAFFTSHNLKPIKFTGESNVYLVSNNSLVWMLNEQVYSLLGFRSGCAMVPDWGQVIELPLHEKVIYESRIKKSILPSENDYSLGNLISYKVIPKVGSICCTSITTDPTTIYLFGDDNKFHAIPNEQMYFDLWYARDWSDVVEISQELFNYYGKGEVFKYNNFFIAGSGGGLYEPEGLTVTTVSQSQINLSWNRGLNPSEYANLRYRIYCNSVVIATTANTNYSNTGLNSGIQCCYQITAYIDDHESDYSNTECTATQSSNILSSSDYMINRATICKDVTRGSNGNFVSPYDPVNETSIFYPSDGRVAHWIRFDSVSKRIRVDWHWYDSYDNLVDTKCDYVGVDGMTYYSWSSWEYTSVNTGDFGQRKVEVYFDEELAIVDYFTVTINLSAPTGLTAKTISQSQINLSWNSIVNASGYKIYRDNALIATLTGTVYPDTGLSDNTQHCYKVKAYCGNRDSDYSNQVCANILLDIPEQALGAPTRLHIVNQ